MAPVLFTIGGALMNALALGGTNFSLARLWIMVKKNAKDVTWHLKNLRGLETNGTK